jgi:hypothetical protein
MYRSIRYISRYGYGTSVKYRCNLDGCSSSTSSTWLLLLHWSSSSPSLRAPPQALPLPPVMPLQDVSSSSLPAPAAGRARPYHRSNSISPIVGPPHLRFLSLPSPLVTMRIIMCGCGEERGCQYERCSSLSP